MKDQRWLRARIAERVWESGKTSDFDRAVLDMLDELYRVEERNRKLHADLTTAEELISELA